MTGAPTTEQLADEIAATHVSWFREHPTGGIAQTCLIFPEEGKAFAVECGWRDEDERRLMLAVLRATMATQRAIRYAIWSEIWMAMKPLPEGRTAQQEIDDADYQHGDISRDPDRVEAVFTLVVEASGKQAIRLQKIVRGRRGGVRRLEPLDGDPSEWEGMGGALGDLLPERTFQ